MVNFGSGLAIGLGALGGVGNAMRESQFDRQRQQEHDTALRMKMMQGQGEWVPTDMPGPDTITVGNRHYKLQQYPQLGEEGARNLGLTRTTTSTGINDPFSPTPGFAPDQLVTQKQERVIPGVAQMRMDPKTLLQLLINAEKERLLGNKERAAVEKDDRRQKMIARALGVTDPEATSSSVPMQPGLPGQPPPEAGIPAAPAAVSGRTAGATPAVQPQGEPLRQGNPKPWDVGFNKDTFALDSVTGADDPLIKRVSAVHAQFLRDEVKQEDLPNALTKSGVPAGREKAMAAQLTAAKMVTLEQELKKYENASIAFASDPQLQRAFIVKAGRTEARIKLLGSYREKLLDQAGAPAQKALEAETVKEATAGSPRLLEAMRQLIREKKLPKDIHYPQLDDGQKAAVDDRAREIDDHATVRKQQLRTKGALQVAEGKFEQNKQAGAVALKQLHQLVDTIFMEEAPEPKGPAELASLWRRAKEKGGVVFKRLAQSKGAGEGADIATYEDTATAHIITIAKGLTGTGRIAWQEIRQVLGGLPKISTGVHGLWLMDTKLVAQQKMDRIEGLFNKAIKTPAGTYAPFDIHLDSRKEPVYVPLGGEHGPEAPAAETETVAPPSTAEERLLEKGF